MDKKFEYMGFLTGFDVPGCCSTDIEGSYVPYLDLNLKYGFKIRCDNLKRVTELISQLDETPFEVASEKLLRYGVNSHVGTRTGDTCVYYIHYYFNEGEFLDVKENIQSELEKFFYPDSIVQRMRLFKEGNISLSLYYSFYYENGVPMNSRMGEPQHTRSQKRFLLSVDEVPKLEEFLNTMELPFQSNFKQLNLAFKNYQLSYIINPIELQYLTLMNSMEVLFHPSREGELRNRISRNTAVLLGESKEESQEIFSNMIKHYDNRSDIVHRGESDITSSDVYDLRHYVRESIKEIYRINKNKHELLKILNCSGFGTQI